MRNIVHIGLGQGQSLIHFQESDCLITCDPMLSFFQEKGIHPSFPDFVDVHLSCCAIGAKNGKMDFVFPADKIESGFLDESKKTDQSLLCLETDVLTLDTWLARYTNLGFTASIDLLYSPAGTPMYDMFSGFSWCVKPKIIIGHAGPKLGEMINLLYDNEYTVLMEKPLLAISSF